MPRIFKFVCLTWMVLLICAWMPSPGDALKCYVCNSLASESCTKLEGEQHLKKCEEFNDDTSRNYTVCRKQIFSAYSKKFEMHTQRTIRSCGYEKHPRLSCFHSSNIDLKGTTCECLEDGCNGSNQLHFMLFITIVTLLSSIIYPVVSI
ncbi:uncharacterized protein LOC129216027 [Uloborus diversus]|uniref:uncharacterized protein LOC129216027 n=1 Tax=Uloborus diversus TaxID=327109 RepID=UPI002409AFFB|nr:uncharacterized protein LOC129216027 [Uloborus diversus]